MFKALIRWHAISLSWRKWCAN